MKKKIDQSRKAKKEFDSPMLLLLKSDKRVEKNVLRFNLQEQFSSLPGEREIRKMVEEVSYHYAVVSSSKKKGYRLAKPINNLSLEELQREIGEVEESTNEDLSRISKLKRKMKPKIAWLKVAEKKALELKANSEELQCQQS